MAEAGSSSGTAFTLKAVLFGLAGVCAIVAGAAISNLIDNHQSSLIGNHLPPAPFAFVVVLALLWNPTAGRLAWLRFSTRELVVALGLTLLCAWIPYSSLYRYFQRAVVTPQVQADGRPEWRTHDTIGHLPQGIFPLDGSAEAMALNGAIAAERSAAAAGTRDAELAASGAGRDAYGAALDLATLVPPRLWLDEESQELAGGNLQRAMIRAKADDPARWQAAGALLQDMPASLSDPAAPPAWRVARTHLTAGMSERLPEARREFERVYTGSMQGLTVGNRTLPLSEVPFGAWLPTFAYWAPLIIFLALAVLMLSLLVHRQWSSHEQLTYPIAQVSTALLQRSPGRLVSDVFTTRLFWWGFVPVLGVHAIDYLAMWFPGRVPWITLHWQNYEAILTVLPGVAQSGGIENLAHGSIYFTVIGLAYFISSEVSLSLGISGFLVVLLHLQWYAISGDITDLGTARSGAYVAYAGVLLYTGRHYYWNVLLRAWGMRGGAGGDHAETVWAARLFLLGFAGLVCVLCGAFAMDWLVALAYALTLMIMFLVLSRIVCETGIPFLQAGWQPAQLLVNTLGIGAIGPGPFVLMCYLGSFLTLDPRECLMPYAANTFKMAENVGIRRFRFAAIGFGAILLALVVGMVATSWGMYNFGSGKDGWAQYAGSRALDGATRELATLASTGEYAASAAATGLEKIPLIGSGAGLGKAFGFIVFGAVGVLVFSLLRYRYAGFMLHPVLFLFWGTYPATRVWFSFLVGWGIKSLIVRYAGGRVYQDLKPLFIGLIAGELMAASLVLICDWAAFLLADLPSRGYMVFPS